MKDGEGTHVSRSKLSCVHIGSSDHCVLMKGVMGVPWSHVIRDVIPCRLFARIF